MATQGRTSNRADGRRYVKTGVPNIQRLVSSAEHESLSKGALYLSVKRFGKRWRRALETNDLSEGKKRAKVLLEMIRGEKWDELQGAKTRAGWATLPQIYEKYLETATIRTAKRNVAMLRHLLRLAGKDPEGSSVQLGGHTVWQFQQALVKAAGEDAIKRIRAERSANSILRQARSVFAAPVMPAYRDLTLPELDGFLKAAKLKAPAVQYVAPPADVIARISKDYPALKAADPGGYAAFLLGAFLGLRNGEAAAAEWSWVERDGEGRSWLRLATRPHWKTKTARGRDVEIPAGVLLELEAVRGISVEGVQAEQGFLIPAPHETERKVRVFRRLNGWLRTRGLTVQMTPKGFYELRKYFTNRQAWDSGAYRAARAAGNSPAVVERYYADAGNRAPIEIPAPAAP
jgi:integrase